MRKKHLLPLLLAIISFIPAVAGIEAMRGKVVDGYDFWFYTPDEKLATAEDSINGKPLVIFLHGASLCGNDLNKVKRYGTINALEKGRALDAYVIAPQNPGGSWKPEKVMRIVDYISARHAVDPNRIYVLGMSLGGYGTIDFAAAYPDRVAAAIGICGGATAKNLDVLAEVPLWIIHGTGDRAVSVSQSDRVAEAIRKAQGDSESRLHYDRVPGMNHSQPARVFYNPATYEWLFSHTLDTPGRPINETPKLTDSFMRGAYGGLDHSKGYKSTSKKKAGSKSGTKRKTTKKK